MVKMSSLSRYHVCQLAGRDRAFFLVFLEFGVRGAHGVGLYGFRQGQFLLRKPTTRILAVQVARVTAA